MEQVREFFTTLEQVTLEDMMELFKAPDGLYNIYKRALDRTADNGTLMHAAIEVDLNGEREFFRIKSAELSDPSDLSDCSLGGTDWILEIPIPEWLPEGWANFKNKYEIQVLYMEERFLDNDLMVCGQPDLVCMIRKRVKSGKPENEWRMMVLDWKSSKKPSIKHKIQISIYAKNCQWDGQSPDGAMVVCFGAENKQGFSTSTVKKEDIEVTYMGMKHLKKAIDLCAPTHFMKFWEG